MAALARYRLLQSRGALSVWTTTVSRAKTAEPIEMQFGRQTRVDPTNRVSCGVHALWRHLANTFERLVVLGRL